MTKIKADVSGSDPDKALSVGNRKSPRPGMYVAEIDSVKYRDEKEDLEVTYKITAADKEKNEQFVGSRLWSYVMLEGHPSWEQTQWKLDQLLQAVGLATKKKRKVAFDTDDLEGEEVVVIVVSDTNKDGDYRGAVGGVMMYDEETFGQDVEEDDDDEEPEPDEYRDEDDEEEAEPEDEGDEEPYEDWSLADLKAELDARGLDAIKGKAKIIEALEADDESEESDDDDEESEPDDDEAGDYDELSVADLRKECVERGLKKNGTKAALIARLEEFDENPTEDGSEPDDDDEDEEEEAPAPRRRKATASKKTTAKRTSSKKTTRQKGSKDDSFPFEDK